MDLRPNSTLVSEAKAVVRLACSDAGSVIPAGFVVRHAVDVSRASVCNLLPRVRVTQLLRLESDEERRHYDMPEDVTMATVDSMRAWARQAAKDMAHVLLMRANPTPTQEQHTPSCTLCRALEVRCEAWQCVARQRMERETVGKERADGARITHGRAHGNAPAE